MQIGPYLMPNRLVVAPMAGVTDRPFRQICRKLGAGYAISEMAASNPQVWHTDKSRRRLMHDGEPAPAAIQLVGSSPELMADAARYNVDQGAQIIDINMGCPAKKVCSNWCGSALLQDESLVGRILEAVVHAVAVPVTLKFRTGWDHDHINAPAIARMAEGIGIAALALHGRTRSDGYLGTAEYDTVAEVKSQVSIPVIANGDIDSPEKAAMVLQKTGVDGLMVGRAAQGRPWIFREIDRFLSDGTLLPPPKLSEVHETMRDHLMMHYAFYGENAGVRTARKHIGWYSRFLPDGEVLRQQANQADSCEMQLNAVDCFFSPLLERDERLQY
ncbi:MAG: tRNA dihydrouridine synthase DusB [Oxalobacter sp.]|nr:tRNA dihydrouridine synthase DusB [Oxalobacter sp.]